MRAVLPEMYRLITPVVESGFKPMAVTRLMLSNPIIAIGEPMLTATTIRHGISNIKSVEPTNTASWKPLPAMIRGASNPIFHYSDRITFQADRDSGSRQAHMPVTMVNAVANTIQIGPNSHRICGEIRKRCLNI